MEGAVKVKVDAVPACYALDSAVAIAQGLHIDNLAGYWKNDAGESVHPTCVGCDGTPTWHPSGDIKAAWELAEAEKLFIFPIKQGGWFAGYWPEGEYCEFSPGPEPELCLDGMVPDWSNAEEGICAFAETAPLAIARAFLKSKGVFEIEAEWQEAQYSEGTGLTD